jgi:hypothetical protein
MNGGLTGLCAYAKVVIAATQPGATLRRSVWDRWTIRLRLPLTTGVAIGKGIFGFR